MEKQYYVYILTNITHTVFYVGVTGDLIRRIYEHQQKMVDGFAKKYNVKKLVYYEIFGDIEQAILREKRLKRWNRQWKIELIETVNPGFEDLTPELA